MLEFAIASVVFGAVYFDGDGYFKYADVMGIPNQEAYLLLQGKSQYRASCWINMHGTEPPNSSQVILQMMSGLQGLGYQFKFIESAGGRTDTFALTVTSKTDSGQVYSATVYASDNLVTSAMMVDHSTDPADDAWTHIAFDVFYTTSLPSLNDSMQIRLWVNGNQEASVLVNATSGSVSASQRFDTSNPPDMTIGGNAAGQNFVGEIADYGIGNRVWRNENNIKNLYGVGAYVSEQDHSGDVGQSYGDVVNQNDQILYAPLSLDEPFNATAGSVFTALASTNLTFHRTLGPPISYANARPTIMIIGDTQSIASGNDVEDSLLASVARHIVDYQDTFNLSTVFHVGDWAGNWHTPGKHRRNNMYLMRSLLHADIPFALTMGDHEFFNDAKWRQSRCFLGSMRALEGPTGSKVRIEDELFGSSWFINNLSDSNGDPIEFEEDLYTYSYEFDIDGIKHLAIVLPHGASLKQLQWTVDEAARHDGSPESAKDVWIITHSWLMGGPGVENPVRLDGSFGINSPSGAFAKSNDPTENCVCIEVPPDSCNTNECTTVPIICDTSALAVPLDPAGADPGDDEMWETYLANIPNLVGIICGHFNYDAISRCDAADNGNPVWQLLVNSQNTQQNLQPIDKGAIQILRFVDADTVDVTTWGLLTGEQRVNPSKTPPYRFEFMFDLNNCTPY